MPQKAPMVAAQLQQDNERQHLAKQPQFEQQRDEEVKFEAENWDLSDRAASSENEASLGG